MISLNKAIEFYNGYKDRSGGTVELMQQLLKKLAEYEDLEKRGLLLRLPCGIGADVYFIPNEVNYKLNILQGYPESNRVYHQKVERITFTPNGWYLECDKDIEYATDHIWIDKLYKETWFLTQAEAVHKLKEISEQLKEVQYNGLRYTYKQS